MYNIYTYNNLQLKNLLLPSNLLFATTVTRFSQHENSIPVFTPPKSKVPNGKSISRKRRFFYPPCAFTQSIQICPTKDSKKLKRKIDLSRRLQMENSSVARCLSV